MQKNLKYAKRFWRRGESNLRPSKNNFFLAYCVATRQSWLVIDMRCKYNTCTRKIFEKNIEKTRQSEWKIFLVSLFEVDLHKNFLKNR